METTVFLAALCGIGLAMLWARALPVKSLHDFVIIRLNRIFEWFLYRKLPSYPFWFLKGVFGCESCLAPWLALGSGLALGLWWYSIAAMPVAYATYHLLIKPSEPK